MEKRFIDYSRLCYFLDLHNHAKLDIPYGNFENQIYLFENTKSRQSFPDDEVRIEVCLVTAQESEHVLVEVKVEALTILTFKSLYHVSKTAARNLWTNLLTEGYYLI
jgi:hypothetical protein